MNGVLQWLLALYLVQATFAGLQEDFKHYAVLDANEDVKLFWSIDSANEMIHFAVQAKTLGWVGLGISSGVAGQMKGADIVIGWVKDGEGYLAVSLFAESELLATGCTNYQRYI